jgi:flagellin
MALVVNTNVASLNAQRQLNSTTNEMSTAMERLSSGSRINTAADDAAGLSIVTRMDSQVKGLNMAIRNANDGISLAQTAEGAMEEVTSMLQRMRELSVQASNSLNTDADRTALNDEVQQLKAEVDRIATDTRFNNQAILNGSLSTTIQIGDQVSQSMSMAVGSLQTAAMGETTTGPATAATMASLSASGASSTAADYQGKTFSVTTNGVAETVDLPSATKTVAAAATAATSTAAVNGADRAVSGSSSAQIGAISESTIDVSTAANGQLKLTVNGGTEQTIDIASQVSALGYTNTALTGTQLVTALQNAIDANGTYVDANAITVSLDSNHQVQLSLTSGAAGTIAVDSITEGTNSAVGTGLVTTLGGSHLGETSSTGTLVIGGTSTPRTLDLSGDAANTEFSVVIPGFDAGSGSGTEHDLDLSAKIVELGYDVSALTATEFATALEQTLEASSITAVTVAHQTDGTVRLTFDDALASEATSGVAANSVSLEDRADGAGNLLEKLNTGAAEVNGTGDLLNVIDFDFFAANQESFGQADLTIQTGTVDLSSASSKEFVFNDGSNETSLDLGAAITSLGYTASAMTGAQLAQALQTTINDNSNYSGYTVTASSAGVITIDAGTSASKTLTVANEHSTPAIDGTLLNVLGVGAASVAETSDDDIAITVAALAKNDEFSLTVNGGSSATLTVAAGTYDNMSDLAAAAQTAITNSNNFTGDYAVTVSAGTDADGTHGLVFTNAAGKEMSVSGALVTQTLGINSQVNDGTKIINSSNEVTINSASYAPQAATNGVRTVDLGSNNGLTFSINVNGQGARDFDLGSVSAAASATNYIRASGATADTAITGEQLVSAINAAFAANADIQGDNNVVAAINADGALTFTVSGGAQTLVVGQNSGFTAASDGLIHELTTDTDSGTSAVSVTASSGVASTEQLAIAASATPTEIFGERDITVATGVSDTLTLEVGTKAAQSITLTALAYDNMAALVTEIQTRIDATSNFTGDDALTVTEVTDSNGEKGFNITDASGEKVKITGNFTTQTIFTQTDGNSHAIDPSGSAGLTFPAARAVTGGVDLSTDNQVQMAVTKADGSVISRTLTLGGSDDNTSFSDYASLLQTAANSAFAGDSLSFTAGVSNGSLSVALDQAGANSINLSGTSVTDIASAAMTASGTAATVDAVGTPFSSMADVVSAMNDDLSNASVSYSAASGFTFTATSGSAGAANTIAIAGDDLADVQMTAGSATGADGNATAVALSTITVDTTANAAAAIGSIDNAIEFVNLERSNLGAIQNRLSHTVNNLSNIVENTSASRSRIEDADFATEAANLAKAQVLQQAGTAMLAQANAQSQIVLSLLG